jgi:hypothetical protein
MNLRLHFANLEFSFVSVSREFFLLVLSVVSYGFVLSPKEQEIILSRKNFTGNCINTQPISARVFCVNG